MDARRSGDLIPRLNALVYLEKPPLQYRLTAPAYRGFGRSEFAVRLCTGLAGYLSLTARELASTLAPCAPRGHLNAARLLWVWSVFVPLQAYRPSWSACIRGADA
jgi:hypothetical protein